MLPYSIIFGWKSSLETRIADIGQIFSALGSASTAGPVTFKMIKITIPRPKIPRGTSILKNLLSNLTILDYIAHKKFNFLNFQQK